MLSSLKYRDKQREEGFTLIELLVVVIIIGILAAIAIPVFLSQRDRAWRGAVQSDLRNAAVAMETYFTDHGTYHEDGLDAAYGFAKSEDVEVEAHDADDNGYCLQGDHDKLNETWSLSAGGLLEQSGC